MANFFLKKKTEYDKFATTKKACWVYNVKSGDKIEKIIFYTIKWN